MTFSPQAWIFYTCVAIAVGSWVALVIFCALLRVLFGIGTEFMETPDREED